MNAEDELQLQRQLRAIEFMTAWPTDETNFDLACDVIRNQVTEFGEQGPMELLVSLGRLCNLILRINEAAGGSTKTQALQQLATIYINSANE